ncbi:unnamed protein product, partial [Heterosigma akashiwo]
TIAAPLYKLTKDKPKGVLWDDDCEWAFQEIKDSLTTAPVLMYPRWDKPFIVETDASKTGLGAILLQQTQRGTRPIAYASRLCSPTEANYSATELECLGVIYALQQFRCYVMGREFTLVTDHKSLEDLKRIKNPTGRRARWLMTLMEFMYNTQYRKGKLMAPADALSRLPRAGAIQPKEGEADDENIMMETEEKQLGIRPEDISKAQQEDEFCGPIMEYLKTPGGNKTVSREIVHWSRYMILEKGLLWHQYEYQGDNRRRGTRIQLVVPTALHEVMLQWAHQGTFGAHIGRDKALEILRQGYFWVNMARDMTTFVNSCQTCQRCKNPAPQLRARVTTMQRPMASQPFQVIHGDACTIRSRNIMIFVDQFSGYVELELMRGPITGRSLAEAFLKCIVCRHSTPSIAIMDNVNYQVKGTFPQVLRTLGVKLTPVSVYHPQANGRAERMVSIIKKTLKTMVMENTSAWEKLIPLAAFACNTAQHRETKETPFFLVHGRDAVLPGPLNTAVQELRTSAEVADPEIYVQNLGERILTAFKHTTERLKAIQNSYAHPDLLEEKFKVGERVWMLDPRKATGDNLKPMWKGPFEIIHVISAAVYQVQEEEAAQPILAHVNRLKKATA